MAEIYSTHAVRRILRLLPPVYLCLQLILMNHTMNFAGLILLAGTAFSSCGNAATGEKSKHVVQDAQAVPEFVNGITDQNRGDAHGPVTLSGTVSHQAWNKLYLYSTYGKTNTLMDSADVRNGVFRFGTSDFPVGFYMLGPADDNLCPVILNPAEPEVSLQVTGLKMDGGCKSAGSRENEAWLRYYPKENALLRQIRDFRAKARKSSMAGEFEKQATEKEAELQALRAEQIAAYPGTYFAKTLTWKQEPEKTDKTRYWNNIDFTDESIVRSLVLSDRIQNFMRAFSRGEESGFIECIGIVAERAKANDVVLEFALNQMLIGFYESGMEKMSLYLIDNYIHGDACGDASFSSIIENTARSIAQLGTGKTPPNITGKGADGKPVDLMKTAAANTYTLLMFWSSWCEHCKGEAPEIVACHSQWKSRGFEIIGYSVDQQEAAWRSALTERSFAFPNLCGYKLWDSKAARDYRITRTPGFFLLDQSGAIVLKPKSIREVQAFLAANLK
jgi:peroxiredoxin